MAYLRALVSIAYWKHGFSLRKAGLGLLSSFGTLWLAVEIATYFSAPLAAQLKERADLFFAAGVLFAAYLNRPLLSISCQLKGRDVVLRITVGDALDLSGALVVGCNTAFETSIGPTLIASNSVQGKFTARFFDSPAHLAEQVAGSLRGQTPTWAPGAARALYPIGTCAIVSGRGKRGYLLAIASLNDHGVARGSLNDLQTALPLLWECVATRGTIEPLVTPVLGTGYSRLPEPREQVIREIVNSFVAACAAQRFTESLTIVIPARDFFGHSVNMPALSAYLQHVCTYSEYSSSSSPPSGRAVELR